MRRRRAFVVVPVALMLASTPQAGARATGGPPMLRAPAELATGLPILLTGSGAEPAARR